MNGEVWADTQEELEGKVCFPRKCKRHSLSSSPLSYLFSLGPRSAVLRTGEREAWALLMVLGWHVSPRESISARRRGGKSLIKTMWLKEKGKDQNHAQNVGDSQGLERRWIKWMKRTMEDRQATNLWLWKSEQASSVQATGNTGATRSHLVFWPWTYTLTSCASVCMCMQSN